MIPINNSDTAWLIVSDYNQDNSLPYEELREDILNPNTNQWHWISLFSGVGTRFDIVGGRGGGDRNADIDGFDQSTVGSLGEADQNTGMLVGGLQSGGVGDNYDSHKPIRYRMADSVRL